MPRPATPLPTNTSAGSFVPHLAAARCPTAIAGGDLDGTRCSDIGVGISITISDSFTPGAVAGIAGAFTGTFRPCAHAAVLGQQVVVDGGSAHYLLQGLGKQAEVDRGRRKGARKRATGVLRS